MRLALAVAVTALASASCKKDHAAAPQQGLESRIRARVAELGIPASTVTCTRSGETGASFACTVEIAGQAYELDATVEDASASGDTAEVHLSTRWARGDAVVGGKLAPKLAAAMSETLGLPVQVSCGEPLRFLEADRTVRCDLTAGHTRTSIVTTFDAHVDPTSWKLDPPALVTHKLEGILNPAVHDKIHNDHALVTCGSEPLILRPADGVVPCTLALSGQQAKLAVTVDDKLEVTRWQVSEGAGQPTAARPPR